MDTTRLLNRELIIIALLLTTSGIMWDGDPIPGLDISLQRIPRGRYRHVETDDKGNATFSNQPAGKYEIMYSAKSNTNQNNSPSNRKVQDNSEVNSQARLPTGAANVKLLLCRDKSTHWDVTITIDTNGSKADDKLIEITIAKNADSIVVHADGVPIKEEEIKN